MALTIVDDYTNEDRFSVGINLNEHQILNDIIDITQQNNLECLLGAREYNLFEDDLDVNGDPESQKWIDFVGGVVYIPESDDDISINYRGVIDMLKGFTFFEYVKDYGFKRTGGGVKELTGENSVNAQRQFVNGIVEPKYNESVVLYRFAQAFLNEFEDYSVTSDSIVEAPALTYTVLLTDTKYLADGDTVTIDGNEYTVGGLVADTSFTFISTAGLVFADLEVSWKPFGELDTQNIEEIGLF